MAMSFSGISSGLPTDQLIQAMLEQQYAPISRLQDRQDLNNMKKSALSSIKSGMMALATSFTTLNATIIDRRTITSSDGNAVSATGAGAASGTYDLVVNQLATKARAESIDHFASTTASVGAAGDVYTITNKDGESIDIALQAGKTSLADLADAINAEKDSGVTASIVQKNPGQYHLVLTSTETGLGKDGGSTVSISGGAFGAGMNATETAQNAEFKLNGVDMSRTSNTISDAVDGVTFTLKQADPNKTVSLSVAMDKDYITKAFQDVIDKFNAVYKMYKDASAGGSGYGGPLASDATMRNVFTELRSRMSVAVNGESGGIAGSSAGIGFTTNRDGTLSLDAAKLSEALDQDPELVGKIFAKASTGANSFIDGMTIGTSASLNVTINNIDTQNSTLGKQIDTLLGKIDRQKEILTARFAKLETIIGQLQAAGQSLGALG